MKLLDRLVLAGFMLASFVPALAAEDVSVSGLSPQELAWLAEHPVIRVGVDPDYAPYSFNNGNGSYQGIALDFLDVISTSLGLETEIIPDLIWTDIVNDVERRELDMVLTMVQTPERDSFVTFSNIYLSTPLVIMRRIGDESVSDDLTGVSLALVEGYSSTERVLELYPEVEAVMYETAREALFALATRQADAYVGVLGVNYYLTQQYGIAGLEIASFLSDGYNGQRLAVRNDWPELAIIFDKALAAISEREKREIFERWLPVDAVEQSGSEFQLTREEEQWLTENPVIRLGVMDDWPPLNFQEAGVIQGIGMDFAAAINRRLNNPIVVEAGSFESNYNRVINGELDALMDITSREERGNDFNFTRPYFNTHHVFVAPVNGPYISSPDDLAEKTVALERGFFNVTIFRNDYPDIRILEYETTADALDAVARGEADAYAGNRSVANYLIARDLQSNLQIQARLDSPAINQSIGVRKDLPVLAGMLDRALASITQEEKSQIYSKWLAEVSNITVVINLTPEELNWLDQNPVLLVGYDNNWRPISYLEDGNFVGMAADYIARIEELLGIQIRPVAEPTWSETRQAIADGELDLLAQVTNTHQCESCIAFTTPYLDIPMMLVTKDDVSYEGMSRLDGRNVAVVTDYAPHDLLRNNHPFIHLKLVPDVVSGLNAVLEGEADAFIGSLPAINYSLAREEMTGLKVSGEIPYRFELSIGVRLDAPILVTIIQKALDAIGPGERDAIYQKWFSTSVESKINYTLIIQVAIAAIAGMAFFTFWNINLKHMVAARIGELAITESQLEEAQRIGHMGNWQVDHSTGVFICSHEIFNIYGIDDHPEKPTYEFFRQFFHPDDIALVDKIYKESVAEKKDFDLIHRIIRKSDGAIRHIHQRATQVINERGKVTRTVGTEQDVTELLEAEEDRDKQYTLLQSSLEQIVQAMAHTVEMRDPFTAGHQRRVAEMSVAIADAMGLDSEKIKGLQLGCIIHDIGKLNVPAEILNRPGKLSSDEFEIVKTHSEAGYNIVRGIQFPWPVADMIHQHHERLDGSGYPQGLKGDEIILEARILAVADVVEAMLAHRPYRPSLTVQEAVEEIKNGRGVLFDAQVVDVCIALLAHRGMEAFQGV